MVHVQSSVYGTYNLVQSITLLGWRLGARQHGDNTAEPVWGEPGECHEPSYHVLVGQSSD